MLNGKPDKGKMDLIRQVIAEEATDLELQLLIELAQAKGLDVLLWIGSLAERRDARTQVKPAAAPAPMAAAAPARVEDEEEPDESDEASHLRAISQEVSESDRLTAIRQRLKLAMEKCFQDLKLTSKQFDDWYCDKCTGQSVARQQELLSKLQTRVMEFNDRPSAEVEVTGPMADAFARK
jgi:hypothetical protein